MKTKKQNKQQNDISFPICPYNLDIKKDTIIRHRGEYEKNRSNGQPVRQYSLHICSLTYSGLCKRHGRKELDGDELAFSRGLQQAPQHQGNVDFLKAKHEAICSFRERQRRFSRAIPKWHVLLARVRPSVLRGGQDTKHTLLSLAELLPSSGSSPPSCLPQIPSQGAKFPAYPWIRFGCQRCHWVPTALTFSIIRSQSLAVDQRH